MRLALAAVLALLAAPVMAQTPTSPAYDADGWVSDLNQVRQAMGSHYANLDWAVNEREAPLGQLFIVGERRLRTARNDADAREVFERLERFIGDGHFDFVWNPNSPASASVDASAHDTRSPCEVLGFRADNRDGTAIATRLPGYQALDGESGFPAGVVDMQGQRIGVIRIAQMSAYAHPQACAAAFAAMTRPVDAPCDDDCLERLRVQAVDRVTDDLTARIRALRDAGADTLLVDLAGNGGGSEWTEVAVRLFSPVRLKSARVSFPRHPHWVERFTADEVRLARTAANQNDEDRRRLEDYAAVFAQARQQAAAPCDPAPWFTPGGSSNCAWLTTAPLYATGPVADLDPAIVGKPWAAEVFTPLKYRFTPGVWAGPLLVLVDHDTGSAAEQFAGVLQDNNAGVIVGSPTSGAGCGHARGEITTVLAHSGARLRLPNCARLRADGTNEVGGIEPDVLVGFRENDGPRNRLSRLTAALPEAVAAARDQARQR